MSYDLTIPQLRYTKAQFEALNPTPQMGQLCIETDTETYTVGMGAATYLSIRGNASLSAEERTSADDVWLAGKKTPRILQYIAYLEQSGTDAIVPTVLYNDTGVTPIYSYSDVGRQLCTLPGVDPLRVVVHDMYQDDIQESKVGRRFSLPYSDGQGNCLIAIQQCDLENYAAIAEFDGYADKLSFRFSYIPE